MAVYVHHSKNGPDFELDQGKIAGLLAEVRFRQGRLMGRIEGMGAEFQSELREQVRTHDQEIMAGPAGKEFARLLLEVTREYAAPLTRERILRWHSVLHPVSRTAASQKGTVHFQVSITGGSENKLVKLIHWVNSAADLDPVIKAVIALLWLVMIRPFDEDSQQLGELVMEMLMARANQSGMRFYSIAAQLHPDRHDYHAYTNLLKKTPADATQYVEWFLGRIRRAIDNAEKVLEGIREKEQFWQRCAGMGLNDRQRLVLEKLLNGKESKLTSSKWALLTNTSQDTAGRDINDLVGRGLLARQAGGGRSTSYAINPAFSTASVTQ